MNMFEKLFEGRDVIEPKHLEEKKIMSKTFQYYEREAGRLGHFRVGKKVFYTRQHIENYFEQSTEPAKVAA